MTLDRSKSNLNIKKRIKRSITERKIRSSRRSSDSQKIKGTNIIFGLDNGATGTCSCIISYPDKSIDIKFRKTPAYETYDYQKQLNKIKRIDWKELKNWFETIINQAKNNYINKYKMTLENIKVRSCFVEAYD